MTHPDQTVRVPTNAEVAALSKALREGGGIITTAGVLTEAARLMIAAAPSPEAEGAGGIADILANAFDRDNNEPDYPAFVALCKETEARILASLQRPQTTAPDSGLVEALGDATAALASITGLAQSATNACVESLAQARKGAA